MTSTSDELTSDLRAARRALVERGEGAWSTEAVAELLDISPEAVRERAREGTLAFYRSPAGGEYRFPRAQFAGDGIVEGLEDVLQAMHVTAPWMRLQLLLDDDVIGALRDGRVDDAIRAVDSYLPRDQAGE